MDFEYTSTKQVIDNEEDIFASLSSDTAGNDDGELQNNEIPAFKRNDNSAKGKSETMQS